MGAKIMKITLMGAILIIVAIIAILIVVNVSTEKPAGSLSPKNLNGKMP
jgi:hypothetical protein